MLQTCGSCSASGEGGGFSASGKRMEGISRDSSHVPINNVCMFINLHLCFLKMLYYVYAFIYIISTLIGDY